MDIEIQIDCLTGPSHNFAGLGVGNLASQEHKHWISYPKNAALQHLKKMKLVADLGVPQAIFPPHPRPNFNILKQLGFMGSDESILHQASAFPWLNYCYTSSFMWMANAATCTPSWDSQEKKTHISVANLVSSFHRFFEAENHYLFLEKFLPHRHLFALHEPLPKTLLFRDEGSANHIRFSAGQEGKGLHLFAYGEKATQQGTIKPRRFIARQTLEASQTIARRHRLPEEAIYLAEQNSEAIDAGAFHNDLLAFGIHNFFILHEKTFLNQQFVLESLNKKMEQRCGTSLNVFQILESELTLTEALNCYLFNSQCLSTPQGLILIVPEQAYLHPKSKKILDRLPFSRIIPVDVNESMQNGGGPACLRLGIPLTHEEYHQTNPCFYLTETLYKELVKWIEMHYRETLTYEILKDPIFLQENQRALVELRDIIPSEKSQA